MGVKTNRTLFLSGNRSVQHGTKKKQKKNKKQNNTQKNKTKREDLLFDKMNNTNLTDTC